MDWRHGSSCSVCFVSKVPWIQTPIPQKKKKDCEAGEWLMTQTPRTEMHMGFGVIKTQTWWHVTLPHTCPLQHAIGRLRQKDCKSEANLGYRVRECLGTLRFDCANCEKVSDLIVLTANLLYFICTDLFPSHTDKNANSSWVYVWIKQESFWFHISKRNLELTVFWRWLL
jgi:hypothetical protein